MTRSQKTLMISGRLDCPLFVLEPSPEILRGLTNWQTEMIKSFHHSCPAFGADKVSPI